MKKMKFLCIYAVTFHYAETLDFADFKYVITFFISFFVQ